MSGPSQGGPRGNLKHLAAILFIPCSLVPVRLDAMNHGVGTGGTILHVETIISRRTAAVERPFESMGRDSTIGLSHRFSKVAHPTRDP